MRRRRLQGRRRCPATLGAPAAAGPAAAKASAAPGAPRTAPPWCHAAGTFLNYCVRSTSSRFEVSNFSLGITCPPGVPTGSPFTFNRPDAHGIPDSPDQVDARSVAPSSRAPAFEAIAPPSNTATTRRPSTGANSNCAGLHSVGIGDFLCVAISLCRRRIFAGSDVVRRENLT